MDRPFEQHAPVQQREAHEGGVLTIDLSAVRANYRLLCGMVDGECGAVVKADGYGLGAAQVARALFDEGCRTFFTAHLAEALALRPHLPVVADIVVLHGPSPGTCHLFREGGVVPVLNSCEQIAEWRVAAPDKACWLQFDSGMTRFGLDEAEIDRIDLQGLRVRAVMSHLACADDPTHPANAAQLACFQRIRRRFADVPASLAASSGIFLGRDYHFDIVRPGAALYGVNPQPGRPNPLLPVIRLQGRVLQLRHVPEGTAIGYGHIVRTDRPSQLATVAVGYADGFLRSTGTDGGAWAGDAWMKLLGRVSMDSIVLDATGVDLRPGMLVDLIDPRRDVDSVGAAAGTIGYEILTSLGHRFARVILERGQPV